MSRRSRRLTRKWRPRRQLARSERKLTAPFARPLRFEPLEDRRLLSITVNTLTDVVANDGVTSLREAIAAAVPSDTINFSVTGTISLTSLGQLTINKNLTIQGPGANLLTIKAYDPDANGANDGDGSRVFLVDDTNAANVLTVSISGLTFTNGDAITSGGAIRSMENLTVTDSTISGNWSSARGGGIYSTGANSQLTLLRTIVSGNAAMSNGGGVAMFFGGTSIDQSTVSNNSGNFSGGGVFQYGGQLTLTRSTISGNSTNNRGGGIYTVLGTHSISDSLIINNTSVVSGFARGGGGIGKYGGSLTVSNSTISGNQSWQNGGGISNYGGTLTVRHSTLTNNWSDVDTVSGGLGGAIFVGSGTVSVDHTIVALNLRGFGSRDDVAGAIGLSFSLIGDNTGATITNNGGNQIGTGATPINPMLGPLIDNGGPTKTYALLPGSPAIDAGNAMIATPPTSDQRGVPFARIADGDGVGGARIDIGAYERQTVPGLNLVVDTLVDEYDLNFAVGDLSLREAISLANGSIGADTITFAAALTSGGPATILLTKGELAITDSVTISGPNDLSLNIDASGNDPTPNTNNGDGSRVFNIDNGQVSLLDVAINLLELTGGDTSGSGGAILTRENLGLLHTTITGNVTTANVFASGGGAIYSSSGSVAPNSLTVINSVISDNATTSAEGGGIRKRYGSLFVLASTITGNFAAGSGGGISAGYGNVDVDIAQSTLSGNSAGGGGGGAFLFAAIADVSDSTIQGNQGNPAGGGVYSASGTLAINRSKISGNSAVDGGGILSIGTITLVDSTVSGNTATTGGGISHNQGNLTINRSTISSNQASQGGGILSETNTGFSTSINSSTISLNIATSTGGGVFNAAGNTFIRNSTLSANQVVTNAGGGIASQATGALTFLYSTIVYNNVFGNDVQFVGAGANTFASGGYNLLGSGNALGAFSQIGDQAGTGNAMLGPLADHGGYTKTHALLPGSTAIDAGDNNNPPPANDQRGFGFARVFDGDGVGGARIDVGAYERQTLAGLNLVVDTLVDENDNIYSPGDLSLREAVALANGSSGADTITFAASLTAGGLVTIHLSMGELLIDESLTITGPGANLLRLDAAESDPTPELKNGDGSRIFNINNVSSALLDVVISGLMLNGGDAAGAGGAILTRENLTIEDSIISGNASSSSGILGGGAIYSSEFGTTLIVRDSTISNNSAVNSEGGGIRKRFGTLLVERSTLSGNTAHTAGGAISAAPAGGTVEIRDSTINGNTSQSGSYGGGGVFLFEAAATISGSTITDNEAFGYGGGIDSRYGSLTVEDCTISSNESTTYAGGGIRQSSGSLLVLDSTIAENDASQDGGGIWARGGAGVEIRDSLIRDNSAAVGGGISLSDTYAEVTGSTLSGNTAVALGGGLYATNGADLEVRGSTISGNSSGNGALGKGGGLHLVGVPLLITNSTISGNTTGQFGGGLYSLLGTVTIEDSTISNNTSNGNGGGVFLPTGYLTIERSSLAGNIAANTGFGGGLYAGEGTEVEIHRSTVSGNSAGRGGGVSAYNAYLEIDASTISGNTASTQGGGVYLKLQDPRLVTVRKTTISGNRAETGGGFALYVTSGLALVRFWECTVTQNHADYLDGGTGTGGGILAVPSVAVRFEMQHTIVADNFKGSGTTVENDVATIALSTWTAGSSYNLIGTGGSAGLVNGVNGNQVGVANPLLGPLADNGGPTMTHALLVGSPAIDAGDPSVVFNSTVFDQRGAPFVRVVDGDAVPGARIDVGAIERQVIPPAVFGDYNQDGTVNAADYTVWRNTLGQTGITAYSGADGDGDGMVDTDDYGVWKSHFGLVLSGAGGSAQATAPMGDAETQPPALPGGASAGSFLIANVREEPPVKQGAVARLLVTSQSADAALLAWLAERANWPQRSDGLDVPGVAAAAPQSAIADNWLPPAGDDWDVVLDALARHD